MENWTAEQIERYLDGEMSPPEQATFEVQLNQDPDLQHALDNHLEVRVAMDVLLREKMAEIYWDTQQSSAQAAQPKVVPRGWLQILIQKLRPFNVFSTAMQPRYVWSGLATASFCLIVYLGLARYTQSYLTDTALLHAAYVPQNAVGTLGVESTGFEAGFKAFNKKDYAAAIPIFEAIPVGDLKYAEAGFYLGHAYLATGNYEAAIATFERIVAVPDSPFAQNAAWNQVLAMLGAGKTKDADFNKRLQQIAENPNNGYAKDAQALQRRLNHWLRQIFL
ncbi:MAG: tetratricopeptide repeat protein [Saprospiraceae bacterium]|nr:tetratricopeptide repeat protein [Saprospiraceae bacterium]